MSEYDDPPFYKPQGIRWFRMFRSMIESGEFAQMGPYAVVTYIIIKSHVNHVTGLSFPSVETISQESGISEGEVKRQLKVLSKYGYLEKQRRGRHNEYKVLEKIPLKGTDGRKDVVATIDYVPQTLRAALKILEDYAYSGSERVLAKGEQKHIRIDRVVVEKVQINNTNIVINGVGNIDLADPKGRERLRYILNDLDFNDGRNFQIKCRPGEDDIPF